jgi:hypothetical protein
MDRCSLKALKRIVTAVLHHGHSEPILEVYGESQRSDRFFQMHMYDVDTGLHRNA